MIDLTPIFVGLFTIGWGLLLAVVIPAIRRNTTMAQQEELNYWIYVAVQAAEQLYKGSGMGKQKKQAVLDFLAEHGYTVDAMAIDAMIESAVFELNRGVI